MKRYALFMGLSDAKQGGWHDFAGDFDTFPEAYEKALGRTLPGLTWWDIVDTHNDRKGNFIVASGLRPISYATQ